MQLIQQINVIIVREARETIGDYGFAEKSIGLVACHFSDVRVCFFDEEIKFSYAKLHAVPDD